MQMSRRTRVDRRSWIIEHANSFRPIRAARPSSATDGKSSAARGTTMVTLTHKPKKPSPAAQSVKVEAKQLGEAGAMVSPRSAPAASTSAATPTPAPPQGRGSSSAAKVDTSALDEGRTAAATATRVAENALQREQALLAQLALEEAARAEALAQAQRQAESEAEDAARQELERVKAEHVAQMDQKRRRGGGLAEGGARVETDKLGRANTRSTNLAALRGQCAAPCPRCAMQM